MPEFDPKTASTPTADLDHAQSTETAPESNLNSAIASTTTTESEMVALQQAAANERTSSFESFLDDSVDTANKNTFERVTSRSYDTDGLISFPPSPTQEFDSIDAMLASKGLDTTTLLHGIENANLPLDSQHLPMDGYINTAYNPTNDPDLARINKMLTRNGLNGSFYIGEDGSTLLTFGGTKNIEDVGADFNVLFKTSAAQLEVAIKAYAEVLEYTEKQGLQPPDITGHSLGGMAAQLLPVVDPGQTVVTFGAPGMSEMLQHSQIIAAYEKAGLTPPASGATSHINITHAADPLGRSAHNGTHIGTTYIFGEEAQPGSIENLDGFVQHLVEVHSKAYGFHGYEESVSAGEPSKVEWYDERKGWNDTLKALGAYEWTPNVFEDEVRLKNGVGVEREINEDKGEVKVKFGVEF